MNPTFIKLEILRILRNPAAMFFSVVLPIFFYVIFGAAQEYSDQRVENGNVAMIIMVTMAGYGAVVGAVGTGAAVALERIQGWGRQLGLTPLRDVEYIGVKTLVIAFFSIIVLAGVYLTGALTDADGTAQAWALSFLILLIGSLPFTIYGLFMALLIRSDAAISAASGSVVILAFLGNVFFPLKGTLLAIAKFTPMYGYIAVAKYPVTEGWSSDRSTGLATQEPLWIPLLNMGVWAIILGALATWAVSRSRERA